MVGGEEDRPKRPEADAGEAHGEPEGGPLPLEPEPEEDAPAPAARPARRPETDRGGDRAGGVKGLDVCPNCGSPMGDVHQVVCLRCGYDLKAMKVIRTRAETAPPEPGRDEDDEAGEEEAEAPPALVEADAGDRWVPAAITTAASAVLAIGYLAGYGGLVAAGTGLGGRLLGLVQALVWIGLVALAAFGGLFVLAHIVSARVGDLKAAGLRVLAVAAAACLVRYSPGTGGLAWVFETAAQALVFVAGAVVLLRLDARDAATLLGITVIALVLVVVFSSLVRWSGLPESAPAPDDAQSMAFSATSIRSVACAGTFSSP